MKYEIFHILLYPLSQEVNRMEKMNYIEPEMEVVLFETEDVIVTSGIELPDHEW